MTEGDIVHLATTTSTRGTVTYGRVAGVSMVEDRGIVTPLTGSGRIAVDGVVASCHAEAMQQGYSHDAIQRVMAPLVWLSYVAPQLAAGTSQTTGLHWYPRMLVGVRDIIAWAKSHTATLAAVGAGVWSAATS